MFSIRSCQLLDERKTEDINIAWYKHEIAIIEQESCCFGPHSFNIKYIMPNGINKVTQV